MAMTSPVGNHQPLHVSGPILPLRLYAYRSERGLEDRRGLWFQKERLKGTVDHRRM